MSNWKYNRDNTIDQNSSEPYQWNPPPSSPFIYNTTTTMSTCYSHIGFNGSVIQHPLYCMYFYNLATCIQRATMCWNVLECGTIYTESNTVLEYPRMYHNEAKYTESSSADRWNVRRPIKFWNSATKTKQHSPFAETETYVKVTRRVIWKCRSYILAEIVPTQGLCINRGPNKPDLANFATSSTWSLSLVVEDITHTGLIYAGCGT